jgi:hypothetical protein
MSNKYLLLTSAGDNPSVIHNFLLLKKPLSQRDTWFLPLIHIITTISFSKEEYIYKENKYS